MSELLLSGEIAGFRIGDSYEAMIKALGRPQRATKGMLCDGYLYGHLEVYFEGTGAERGNCQLAYLNRASLRKKIALRSKLTFDAEGLAWGISPESFCRWMIRNQIPFSYRRDPVGEKLRESIVIDLDGDGRSACFYCYDDGSQELSEMYFCLGRNGQRVQS